MISPIHWLYLNYKYRSFLLPNDSPRLQKLAADLDISRAYTYKGYGLDVPLAQQRITQRKFISTEYSAVDCHAVACFDGRCGLLLFTDWRGFLKPRLTKIYDPIQRLSDFRYDSPDRFIFFQVAIIRDCL